MNPKITEKNPRGAGRKKLMNKKVTVCLTLEEKQKEFLLENGGSKFVRELIDECIARKNATISQ